MPYEPMMRMAIDLALHGKGRTSPNPMVGSLITQGIRIVGQGYHRRAGEAHAEVVALQQAGEEARGGTLFVNLEPCCHHGKTPPCTKAIIESGVREVVIGMIDPNPLVCEKGIEELRAAGIHVVHGILEDVCKKINESYVKYMTTGTPFAILKAGLSLDGKIATNAGQSRWITGEASRKLVHQLRNEVDAVLVGVNTVIQDDPLLTTRLEREEGQDPLRIIVDTHLRIPLHAKVLQTTPTTTVVAVGPGADQKKVEQIQRLKAKVMTLPCHENGIDLQQLMVELGKRSVTSVLLEGGSEVNASALAANIVDKIVFILAPMIIGGREAPTVVAGRGIASLSEAIRLERPEVRLLGNDVVVEAYVKKGLPRR